MSKPKRTSDNYIQLNKKIVQKELRNIILIIAKEKRMTQQEVCYDFIRERANIEIEKEKMKTLKKGHHELVDAMKTAGKVEIIKKGWNPLVSGTMKVPKSKLEDFSKVKPFT